MPETTREMREWQVQQVNANMGISGMPPTAFTRQLQQRYIDGEITVQEMSALTMKVFKSGEVDSPDDPPIEKQEPYYLPGFPP